MAEIYLKGEKRVVKDGSAIREVCEEVGDIPFACNEGVCGTCVISVKEGMKNLSERTQEEIDFLGESTDERLACQCKIHQGSVVIED